MKRALIVDDSRLARHVLAQILMQHGVAADTAESAEEALDYLKTHRPDVVFLDHMMPGMDGFEALEAIKTNPVTATIPVMMYTSKEGEVYLGQARALGALGVLPKSVEPVEVEKVLRSLRLIDPPTEQSAVTAKTGTPLQGIDVRQLRDLLAPLFYEQGVMLREELRRELEVLSERFAPPRDPEPEVASPPVATEATPRRPTLAQRVVGGALALGCALFVYLYFSTASLLHDANDRSRSLAARASALSAAWAAPAESQAARPLDPGVLELLQWGMNQGGRYDFGEVPLDDERANALATLLQRLDAAGFEGIVQIGVHVGRFCMDYAPDGSLVPAAPERDAAECAQVGWPDVEAVALGERQSLGFAYTLSEATRAYPRIRVATTSYGSAMPVSRYPYSSFQTTAGQWNEAAARNHRVTIELIPDAPATR